MHEKTKVKVVKEILSHICISKPSRIGESPAGGTSSVTPFLFFNAMLNFERKAIRYERN
jgi:hypothetical protein